MKHLILFIFFIFLTEGVIAQTFVDHYRNGLSFYGNGDFPRFLESFEKADSLRPNHRVILYNLAAGYALNNQPKKALEVLKYRSEFYAVNDFSADEDFGLIKKEKLLNELVSEIEAKNKVIQKSELAFEVQIEGLHAEGIGFNEKSQRFYITDIRNGWVYSVSEKGKNPILEFDLKEFGFWSAMGLKFDHFEPNRMWVTTSAMTNFVGYNDSLEGRSAILVFDLSTKKLLKKYEHSGNHVYGDLVQSENGDVYFTDSVNPIIYKIDHEKDSLYEFVKNEEWWNLQGLVLSENEKYLYFSDYVTGIQRIDLLSGKSVPLVSNNVILKGADGVYRYQNKIYTLHNGTVPMRLASVTLNEEQLGTAETVEFLDNAISGLDEPTLGVIVGSDLYYIFNSPWGHYDSNSNPLLDEWQPLRINRLPLEGR